MAVVDNIKTLAKKRGWSLQTVAEKAGIGVNNIYRWKKSTPSVSSLEKVAKVFKVKPSELLKDDSDNELEQTTTVDLENDPVVLSYGGKPISKEDMEIIKAIIKRHNWQKKE